MRPPFRCLLVHGYTGGPGELAPLADALDKRLGARVCLRPLLPGHGGDTPPAFEPERLLGAVEEALRQPGFEPGTFVAVGHSTGGTLLLSALSRLGLAPGLLVLAASPRAATAEMLRRWESVRPASAAVSFTDGARLAALIGRAGALRFPVPFPVLALQGESDELLLPDELRLWEGAGFAGSVRTASVPGARHHLFTGSGGGLAVDLVLRAVEDWAAPGDPRDGEVLKALVEAEPEAGRFLARSPGSARHLARCPSALRVVGREAPLLPRVATEPVFLNVEVTTRCNASCPHCARSMASPQTPQDMPREAFSRLLDLLPHAYRVTLVGLGEPLLHPEVVSLVEEVARRGRRAALVTNGSALSPALSEALLGAGLRGIAFSVDGLPPLSETLRPGPSFARVLENLRAFMALAAGVPDLSTAFFTAVSPRNLDQLVPLADLALELKVPVVMVSDLNFPENQPASLAGGLTPDLEARVRAAVGQAFARGVPLLTVRALEEFGLARRYAEALLVPPDQLYRRSERHTHCRSPWQTLPVDVLGNALCCDCQPGQTLGNLFALPLGAIWNGGALVQHRTAMGSESPPGPCACCPRF